MSNRATRKGATVARRASKPSRSSKSQASAPPDPALPLDNAKHELFAIEYLRDFNGTQAYQRVYEGVSYNAAGANAARLLAHARVRARVEHLCRDALAAEKLDAQKVLQRTAKVAFMDIRKAFNEKGAMVPIHELPDDVAFAVAGIEVEELFAGKGADRVHVGYTKKLRLNDRTPALALLGKHYKLFTEKVEVAGPNGGAIPVESHESPEQKAALASVQKRLGALESRVQK